MKPLFHGLCAAFLLAVTSFASFGQTQGDVYRQFMGAKVTTGATDLPLAWCGGMDHPQMAMADLNRDGRNDLVIFEEYGERLFTLICVSPDVYKYDPQYEVNFPTGVRGYIKFVDFNGDDIPDFVHRGEAGVNVSYGYYDNNILKFKFFKELYYYLPGSQWVNVYVAPGGIPIIEDVDGDGDMDILAYDVVGFQIQYYRNCTKEDNLPADSIRMCLKDECWGKTAQYYQREMHLAASCWQTGTTCKGCPEPMRKGTHGSNTLCIIDMDQDGDWDYFNGNESYNDIQFLYNGKSQYGVDSIIAQDTMWSANGVTMSIPTYPAAFHLNVNHKGGKDLLFISTAFGTENHNSIVYYENTGINGANNFVYKSNNYLTDRMIDLGSGSYPVFYDYDKDGKKDLFVGSDGYYQEAGSYNKSRISYYKNTCIAADSYSFELVTDDFLNLSTLDWRGAALAIGDIDNDTLDDLVIGRTDGTFALFKNMAADKSMTPDWQLTIDTLRDGRTHAILDVGSYAAPCIYDIDNNGQNDLISGNQAGDLYFIKNYSSIKGVVGLEKKSQNLGGVSIKSKFDPYSYTAPYIGSIDNSGIDYLMIGTQYGTILRYTGFQTGTLPAQFTRLDSVYSYIDYGKRVTPAFANLDNDPQNLHELVFGNLIGGLTFYKQHFKVGINDAVVTGTDKDVQVYPNPASTTLNINWADGFNTNGISVKLMSVTGQVITHQQYSATIKSASLDVNNIASGMYYCIIESAGNKIVKPVTILK